MNAIEISDLRKTFRSRKTVTHALRGIDLNIGKGEIFGLLGPNGAGKTTTIHILSTLIKPTSGTAKILGTDILEDPVRIRSMTGVCMGGTQFLWDMTPVEILKYYGRLYGLNSRQRSERIERLIKDLGISKFRDEQFYELSTGMKQKVAVAKSLLNEPEVLFLDEPTAGLDVEVAIMIRKYIADLVKKTGLTVILTSHHLYEVEELCKDIAIIDEGKIIAHGSIKDIRRKLKFPDIAYFYLDKYDNLEFLNKLKGVHGYEVKVDGLFVKIDPGADVVAELIVALKKRRFSIIDMEVKKPSLEDVFMKIVGMGK
jgi:ABC-2 type transport system ATP-binding protein